MQLHLPSMAAPLLLALLGKKTARLCMHDAFPDDTIQICSKRSYIGATCHSDKNDMR